MPDGGVAVGSARAGGREDGTRRTDDGVSAVTSFRMVWRWLVRANHPADICRSGRATSHRIRH